MTYRSWERGDPLEVLIRKGQDCTHCKHLAPWSMGTRSVLICDNKDAPAKKRQNAPASRCHKWEHKQQETARAK